MRRTASICKAYNLVRKFGHIYIQLLLHKMENGSTFKDVQYLRRFKDRARLGME